MFNLLKRIYIHSFEYRCKCNVYLLYLFYFCLKFFPIYLYFYFFDSFVNYIEPCRVIYIFYGKYIFILLSIENPFYIEIHLDISVLNSYNIVLIYQIFYIKLCISYYFYFSQNTIINISILSTKILRINKQFTSNYKT